MIRSNALLFALLGALATVLVGCPTGTGQLDDDDDATADDDDDITPPDDDDDDATADDDDATDPPPEVAEVLAVHPLDGTLDHFAYESLWVDFDIEAPKAVLSLVDAAGAVVDGDQVWVGLTRLAFDPASHLAFSVEHTATVDWGTADDPQTFSWSFTTSTTGELPTGADLVGNTYAYALANGTVVAPAGGEALLDQLGSTTFLQGVLTQTDTEISFIAGLAAADSDPPRQDLCQASVDFNENEPALWVDPYFVAGPADVPQTLDLSAAGFGLVDLTFRDTEVSGIFASSVLDGPVDTILEGTFDTVIDVRDAGFGEVCDQLGLLLPGLTCVTCPHDTAAVQCVIINLIDLEATLVEDLVLVPWSEEDVAANPACE